MSEDRLAELRGRKIGFVFQSFHLIPSLTALENVLVPMEIAGAPDAVQRGWSLMDDVGLRERAHHYPSQLSGGEQQRVAIARAIVGDRVLLLADEPTGALDSLTGEAVLRLMRGHCDRGGGGVLVTHDARFAAWADRVIFLRDGKIVDETTAPEGPESILNVR
jgi:putative ABC transport system ATP-binding protein